MSVMRACVTSVRRAAIIYLFLYFSFRVEVLKKEKCLPVWQCDLNGSVKFGRGKLQIMIDGCEAHKVCMDFFSLDKIQFHCSIDTAGELSESHFTIQFIL